jgi:hypothetical protein
MSLKIFLSNRRQRWLFTLALILLLSSACAPQAPLQITDISVTPDPLIGQTATLHIEVMSKFDEPEAAIIVDLPPGVKLMGGDLLWEGSLTANQPQSHEISLCVIYEGDWRLNIETYSIQAENSSYSDSETLHLITTRDTVRVVPGGAYRITQPPEGMVHPTSVPETPPAEICP